MHDGTADMTTRLNDILRRASMASLRASRALAAIRRLDDIEGRGARALCRDALEAAWLAARRADMAHALAPASDHAVAAMHHAIAARLSAEQARAITGGSR